MRLQMLRLNQQMKPQSPPRQSLVGCRAAHIPLAKSLAASRSPPEILLSLEPKPGTSSRVVPRRFGLETKL